MSSAVGPAKSVNPAHLPAGITRLYFFAMGGSELTINRLAVRDLEEAGVVLDEAFGRSGMLSGLRLAYSLQPESWFCARLGEWIVATVGAYDYGPVASIGMMAVAPAAQRQGVGGRLLAALLDYLDGRGCPLSFLDASAAGQRLYPKLGFLAEGETLRMRQLRPELGLPPFPPDGPPSLRLTGVADVMVSSMAQEDLAQVAAFDAPVFGGDRGQVLASFWLGSADRAFVARGRLGEVSGYVMAAANHIGPWVATAPDIAAALLSAALALPYREPPFLTIPSDNVAGVSLLAEYGFEITERLLHMRRGGGRDPRQTRLLYSQASLTLG